MLTGMQPFKGLNEKDLFSKISRGLFKIPETLDFEAKRLISKILVLEPEKRPKAYEICQDRWIGAGRGNQTNGLQFVGLQMV
jgi:serine/threonine protein kinase